MQFKAYTHRNFAARQQIPADGQIYISTFGLQTQLYHGSLYNKACVEYYKSIDRLKTNLNNVICATESAALFIDEMRLQTGIFLEYYKVYFVNEFMDRLSILNSYIRTVFRFYCTHFQKFN